MQHEDIQLSGSLQISGSFALPLAANTASISNPLTGSIIIDQSDNNKARIYNGTEWQEIASQSTPLVIADIEYLVVAGGGGGGGWGGGGGAGGLLSSSLSSVQSGSSFTVTIGAGATATGRSGGNYVAGGDGTDSSIAGTTISTITSIGGGGGGYFNSNAGRNGGSGGGGGIRSSNGTVAGGSGTTGQGKDGGLGAGNSSNNPYSGGGGGGGAEAVGSGGQSSGYYYGGDGGDGKQSNITGTPTYYAGGGGAHTDGRTVNAPSVSSGGQGGGGNGGRYGGSSGAANAQSGTTNTGGGGGAAYGDSPYGLAGGGGSGVAILAYDSGSINAAGGIVGDAGNGRKYNQFNSSGTFKVSSTSDFQIITDSLEVHLDAAHFDSRGTSTWTDLSGNGYNATAVNSPTLNNYDYTLNGTSQEFTIDISGITWGGSATIEGWVKFDAATPANASQTGLWTFDGSSLSQITHYPYTNGLGYFSTFRNSRVGPVTLSASVTRTDWHHIVITSESGGNWIFYQNATVVHTTTADQTTIDTGVTNYIGRSIGGDGSTQDRRVDGNIGQFRLYSKALSASEILQNYNATKTNFV